MCRSIVAKFESLGRGEVSYAEIAKRAWEVGRAALATKVCPFVFACISNVLADYRGACRSCWTMSHGHRTRSRSS